VFRSRNIIFEESTTHLAKQPILTVFSKDNDSFQPKQVHDIKTREKDLYKSEL